MADSKIAELEKRIEEQREVLDSLFEDGLGYSDMYFNEERMFLELQVEYYRLLYEKEKERR